MDFRIALSLVASLALPASAQPLMLDGVWGNEAGCVFARGGNRSDDSRVVLKAGGFETYATLCEWVQVANAPDGTQVVTGLCAHEGEDFRTADVYIVERDVADPSTVRIRSRSGELLGEVHKCP
ncbi:hypothetical protein GA830_16965 [Mesorhizobium sp. NBSH29]|uniref:hypothetical protein n=1 Tax=Mesorhizobium sp. NBSH29 TaxID=2654249 RepID=UPI0018968895|nr:hypothetical protein [Mesorhizobium sp. NBSH29]QPC88258.1 hypothetical protein GA830_16965 [Mesorhizobium sp. NBSH29]